MKNSIKCENKNKFLNDLADLMEEHGVTSIIAKPEMIQGFSDYSVKICFLDDNGIVKKFGSVAYIHDIRTYK